MRETSTPPIILKLEQWASLRLLCWCCPRRYDAILPLYFEYSQKTLTAVFVLLIRLKYPNHYMRETSTPPFYTLTRAGGRRSATSAGVAHAGTMLGYNYIINTSALERRKRPLVPTPVLDAN